jgi:lipoic acid synthetase
MAPKMITKSGLMLGLGETEDELLFTCERLAATGCDILTLGQYLRPSRDQLPVKRYYHPDEFARLRSVALAMGFRHVEAGPLVRSSYHADQQARLTR